MIKLREDCSNFDYLGVGNYMKMGAIANTCIRVETADLHETVKARMKILSYDRR